MIEACTIVTRTGPFSVLARDAAVIAAGFTDPEALWLDLAPADRHQLSIRPELGAASQMLVDYFNGQLDALERIPVDQPGTGLQHQVWSSLRAIPAGETMTYTELAATTSSPRAVRAAGTACGRNRVAVIVACHRALRRDGSLGGYYYGLDTKRWLLAHEARSAGLPVTNDDRDPQRLR
jgi:methylated-DNA-[protein]-cysteine S-methyltransferase